MNTIYIYIKIYHIKISNNGRLKNVAYYLVLGCVTINIVIDYDVFVDYRM